MELLVGSVRRLSESRNKSRSLPLYNKGQPLSLNLAAFQDDGISIASSGKSFKSKTKRKRQSSCLPLPSSSTVSSSGDDQFDAVGTSNSETSCSSVEFLRVPPRSKTKDGLDPPNEVTQSLPSTSDTNYFRPLVQASRESLVSEPGTSSNSNKGSHDSLRRKERLEALKAKIAADRERIKDSSSEEETDLNKSSKMWKFKSDETLHRSSFSRGTTKSRAARTERYLKRKSHDDASLKNVSRSDPNLDFLDYSMCLDEPTPQPSPIEPPQIATPSPIPLKSSHTWQESHAYEQPRRTSDVSGYFSQVETCPVVQSECQQLPKSAPVLRSGFSGPFFPQTRKASPLTVATSLASPIHMAHPSPCDSGLSSQSMASSPSLGRAPTPPPRAKGSVDSGHPVSAFVSKGPRSTASVLSAGSDSVFGRLVNQSPTLTLQSECTSSGRSSPCWSRSVLKPNSNKLPPHTSVKVNSKPSHYQYTDVPPYRTTSPVVYTYTDQAPTFKPPENQFSAYMSDSQIDSNKRLPIRSVFNYQRKLVTPPLTSPPPVNEPIDASHQDVLSDTSNSRSTTWNTNSTSTSTSCKVQHPQPAIAKRPLSMVLEKIDSISKPILRNGLKKSPPLVTPPRVISNGPDYDLTVNGSAFKKLERRNSSANYEEALQELEDIYQSLGLNDEDLLDRAERRDIPTPRQLKRFSIADPMGAAMNGYPLERSSSDGTPTQWPFGVKLRSTPPNRRSAVPDKITDDLANRRLVQKVSPIPKSPNACDSNMSYLQCSPALTPTLAVETFFKGNPGAKNEPHIELDDVTYRKYTQADAGRVPPPHPPFGIPIGPLANSSPNNYLHATATQEEKPVKLYFKPPQEPDVVRDDMAFRNLRRDRKFSLGSGEGALDAACREMEVWPRVTCNGVNKKDRAQRSLSANVESKLISQLREGVTDVDRAQSMTDLIAELEKESRKWESFAQGTDIEDTRKKDIHGSSTETLTEGKVNGHYHQQKPAKNHGAIYSLMSDIKPRKRRESPSAETSDSVSTRNSRSRSPPPIPKRTSVSVLPKRPPQHFDFWSDTEAKHALPFQEAELYDLLATLAPESPSTNGHEVQGEPHGVPISA